MIIKPMKAAACEDQGAKLDYTNEYIATPKLDGIRGLKIERGLVSCSFKDIPNDHIRSILSELLPEGADGEIICPGGIQATTSAVMTKEGEPEFKFYMFDLATDLDKPYSYRLGDITAFLKANPEARKYVVPLTIHSIYANFPMCVYIKNRDELIDYERACLDRGFEGICLRLADGPYKCGVATLKEGYLMKLKPFSDSEAIIIGFGEKMKNNNPAEKDNFGRTKRSSNKANKEPLGTLGQLFVRDVYSELEFKIGIGFKKALAQEIWDNREEWIGSYVKYRYCPKGVKILPRHARFLSCRHPDDMDKL